MRKLFFPLILLSLLTLALSATARDLPEIMESGTLRHLGIPYANFVTGNGDGLDVEVVKLFAEKLGLDYEFVETTWSGVYTDATGREFTRNGNEITFTGVQPIKGDIIAHGMTVIPWRQNLVDFSEPMFPTQIWVMAASDSPLHPIKPSENLDLDIANVKALVNGISVMAKPNTCLDPKLYDLSGLGAKVVTYEGSLNHMAPSVLSGMAQSTILDVPDALVALRKFQGHIKVIGPLSPQQHMAAAFAKDAPMLKEAFNNFLWELKINGTYNELVRKYYPGVWNYFPDFFVWEGAIQ